MTRSNTHLHFSGNCAEAFKFYEKCLGGKVAFSMTWAESPAAKEVPKEWGPKIIHTSMEFDGQTLSADDAPPGRQQAPQGFAIAVNYPDVARAEKVFKALSENGKIQMPFQETFWAKGFGMVVDQFQIPWMINCGKPM